MSNYPDPDFPMAWTELEDGSFNIEWDETHPVTSRFNSWTEQDFINFLSNSLRDALGED